MLNIRNIQLLISKTILNAKLDIKWVSKARVPIFDRFVYIFHKYKSILCDISSVRFLNGKFYYDNRLTPALMPDYLFEISDLNSRLNFIRLKTVLDIGANVGQFAYVLKALYPHLEIYSFEPNSRIFPILEKNAKQFRGWKCWPFGISKKASRGTLYFVPGKSGQGSIFKENATQDLFSSEPQEINIELKPLTSDETARLQIPTQFDFIKIDVEGAEIDVLSSLADVTWRYLYVELSKNRRGSASPEEALEVIRKVDDRVISVLQRPTETINEGPTYNLLLRAD